ncbi:MAG: hypothetical protein ABIA75_00365 [Candidatus Neomarinimicrobiota bacterium]
MPGDNTIGTRLDDTLGETGYKENVLAILTALGVGDNGTADEIGRLREGVKAAATLLEIALNET